MKKLRSIQRSYLNDAEQMKKLRSIQRSYLNDLTPLRNDFLNKRYEFRRLISDPTSNADDIRAKQEEALALETQIQEKVIDYQLKVREILTPRQFKLWISRYKMGHGPMRGHRHGMGPSSAALSSCFSS
jgi:Spy/CpxP family protein refolding chaperone